jgi:hypothetical protein
MAGLVPAIHVFLSAALVKDVDARDKPGHDEFRVPLLVIARSVSDEAIQLGARSYGLLRFARNDEIAAGIVYVTPRPA